MDSIKQEEVNKWIIKHFGEDKIIPNHRITDNRGPDLKLIENNVTYYIESIQYNTNNKGKNQSDFWKAFSQAISRLNLSSPWGETDKVVIALPHLYTNGWKSRINILGKDIWYRIGNAFPELEIWFVSSNNIKKYTWNDAFIQVK